MQQQISRNATLIKFINSNCVMKRIIWILIIYLYLLFFNKLITKIEKLHLLFISILDSGVYFRPCSARYLRASLQPPCIALVSGTFQSTIPRTSANLLRRNRWTVLRTRPHGQLQSRLRRFRSDNYNRNIISNNSSRTRRIIIAFDVYCIFH